MADEQNGGGQGAETGPQNRTPPYIPFSTLLTFLKALKADGLPPQIDKSVLNKLSGSAQGQLKVALKSLGLMEDEKPTDLLAGLVDAYDTPAFEPLLAERLKATYPYIFALDLMTATPTMFADAFKVTQAKEDVLRKCRTFFLHAAKRAGIPLGNRILTGSVPRAPSTNSARKKTKTAKVTDKAVEEDVSGAPAAAATPPRKGADTGKDHPLVAGLLMTLPSTGKTWAVDARASWLRMAASIFENIYQGKGMIEIKVVKDNGG